MAEINTYKALFESAVSALFIGKPDGTIVEANEAACKLFGYSVEEFRQIGREAIIAPDTPGLEEKLKEREEKHGTSGELIGIKKNGERFWGEFSSFIFEGENGEKFVTSVLIDISEKKETEFHLKKLSDELTGIFSSAPDIICTAGFDGYFKKINPAASNLLGYTEEELLSQPFINFVHPDDVQKTRMELSELEKGNTNNNLENRYITKTGKIIWLSWSAKISYEDELVYAVAKDITDQKELELLHDQATRLAAIGSWKLDVNSRQIYWSRITREIHEVDSDFSPSLEEGIQFYKEGSSRNKITEAANQAMESGAPWDLELQIVTAKGNERWVRSIGEAEFVDGKCISLYGSFQDIHESKQIQQKLSIKTHHLGAISKLNSALINYKNWFKALDEHLEMIGEAVQSDRVYYFENHFDSETGEGFTTQKLEWCRDGVKPQINNPDLDSVPFSEVPELVEPMLDQQPSMRILSEIEQGCLTRHVMEDQDIKAFLSIPVMVRGKFYGFVGFDNCREERYWSDEEVDTLKTITSNLAIAIEREIVDRELIELFKEKNSILDSISDAFYAVDENWKVTYFNREAEKLTGERSDEVVGRNIWELIPGAVGTIIYEKFHQVMDAREVQSFESKYPPLDSCFEITAYPSEVGISVYFRDITERKESQKKILHKTRQLDAVAKFNGLLIQENDWLSALEMCLEDFGKAALADRVYFFENDQLQDNDPVTTMRIEWVREGIEPQIENPDHHNLPFSEIRSFIQELCEKRIYNHRVDEIPDKKFNRFLHEQNILSLLAFPVFTGDRFRGFIGFDDCTVRKVWNQEEITFLETIVMNLSTAIENKETEQKIIRNTNQLDAIARFNGMLIKEKTALQALENCFELFGEIVGADRVYYFENGISESTGEHVTSMKIEWTREGFEPQVDKPDNHDIPLYDNHPSIDAMAQNRPYIKIVDKIENDFFRKLLQKQDIKSVLSIPVFVNESFSGFIGFDDCSQERVWSEEEIGFLKTISLNLASALESEISKEQILYKSDLIEAIANINSTFLAMENWKDALYQSFRIIGETVNADRVYYFENHTDPDTGNLLTSQKLEWVKDEQIIQIDNPELQNIPVEIYKEFLELLMSEQAFSGLVCNIQDANLKSILASQDILSILIIPVFVKQQFHGFIGFDDCTVERNWTEEETSFLRSLTTNLSYAIESYQADKELRNLYDELEVKVQALATSNAELEQFAFVASHDLQEPLRMITSFLALIERKYGDKLDKKGHSYIRYAKDGAKRMRQIILDLLDFSRVGKAEIETTLVDLNEIITVVLSLNSKIIEEKDAQISCDKLPSVQAVYSQMQQLFQNLIHNALNYQKPDQKPEIQIYCEETPEEWIINIRDNGIGVDKEYQEKIFQIFQRLHSNEEYSGTGVGLAICKKIVEENGGSIGVNSEEGKGSTFYFTLKKENLKHQKKGA